MASPLSNLVNNLAEGIDKTKGKYGHNNKNCKTSGIKYKDFECCFELQNRCRQFNRTHALVLP